jgi:hypothetical protein
MRFVLDLENKSEEIRRYRPASSSNLRGNRRSFSDLQRDAGNQAIQSLFRSNLLQPKLAITDLDDASEREADAVAARIVGVPASTRQSVAPSNQKESSLQVQQAPQSASSSIPAGVGQILNSTGHPLDPATRAFFEPRLGQGLSHIRIHADQQASDSASTIHALAYTVGNDIAFAHGRYSPHTDEGKRLLAHELVHTVQQSKRGSSIVQRSPDLGIVGIHVVDAKTYRPIYGANVHIDQAGVSGPKSIDLVTDSNGDTVSIQLEEGNYTITVTFWCCDKKVINVHIDGNTANFVDALMQNCSCRISSNEQDGASGAVASADSNSTAQGDQTNA